jgi:hypothetical protein
VNYDSIKYMAWLKEHREVCCLPYVFDYNGKKHRRPDKELTEKMQKSRGDDTEWVYRRVTSAFMASGEGATEKEARESCEARFAANVEKNHLGNASMTMRLEENATYKWSIDAWQTQKALTAWREGSGEFKLTYTPCFMTVEAEWSAEKEAEVLKDLHEKIIVKRWTAYGSCSYDSPQQTMYSRFMQTGSHEECRPAQEPQWAVSLFYDMERADEEDARQRQADRELYWAESGTPYSDRY